MGANLLDLPDEVLVLIFSNLHTSHRLTAAEGDNEHDASEVRYQTKVHRLALCRLALMNRRLHDIVYPLLLEDVTLSGVGNSVWNQTAKAEFMQVFGRTPTLTDHIKSFQICWNSRTPDSWMKDFFETVASAKDLELVVATGFNDRTSFKRECAIVEDLIGGMVDLLILRLDIDGFDITASLFSKICNLPKLASFKTSARVYGLVPLRRTIASPNYCLGSTQTSKDLNTTMTSIRCSGEYLDLEILRFTLSRSPSLRELHITLPGPGIVPDCGMKPIGGKFALTSNTVYRPGLVTSALSPSSSTLEKLVCMNHEVDVPFHDGSILDLSAFQRLEAAKLSVRLLCPAELYDESYRRERGPLPCLGWYKNLPSSLEQLEIHFDYSGGLLWNKFDLESLEGYEEWRQNHNSNRLNNESKGEPSKMMNIDFSRRFFEPRLAEEITTESRLYWVRELIERRFEHLSRLKSFKVIESGKVGRRQRQSWAQLDLAVVYPETFGCPEIDLGILVRTPQGYTAPPFRAVRP